MSDFKSVKPLRYNAAELNERAIEVPLGLAVIRRARGKRVLEVGNVLGHYARRWWITIDRYERSEGVLNVDVLMWRPRARFDLIVSISTLEHVRFDEAPPVPMAVLHALERVKGWLAPGGRLFVTLPLGYNPDVGLMLQRGLPEWAQIRYMRRATASNEWRECDSVIALGAAYDFELPTARAIAIVETKGANE